MKEWAKRFYKGPNWKTCRAAYMTHKRGLCERCLSKGLITPAEIVHHKIHLTPENINDESISLSWDNLEALCRNCHAEEHADEYGKKKVGAHKRFIVDEFGRVAAVDTPLPRHE